MIEQWWVQPVMGFQCVSLGVWRKVKREKMRGGSSKRGRF